MTPSEVTKYWIGEAKKKFGDMKYMGSKAK